MSKPLYDVLVIGGGVTGTAVMHVLSHYTNVSRIGIIEQHRDVAMVNSHPHNNSQTLHFGDIETNYVLEKALPVKDAGQLIMNYVRRSPARNLYQVTSKMVLAVGEQEVAELRARFEQFSDSYPELRLIEADEIAELEPEVMNGRDPKQSVVALLSPDGYAINYQLLSRSFMESADSGSCTVDQLFTTTVKSINRVNDEFVVALNGKESLRARAVIVCAGPQSLIFAQEMGYAEELAFLPVAGSFYFTEHPVLRGKVYTVQTPELPFAAVHGDPDVAMIGQTRFGPTAKVIPMLERHRYNTVRPYLRTPIMRLAGLLTLLSLMRRPVLTRFILKNLFYDWPLIGKWLYLKQMRKIIPALSWSQVRLGKHLGGLRPQIVDTRQREMLMGESTVKGDRIIFNTTPSPGASVSLKNAESDVAWIIRQLGPNYTFDQEGFDRDLRN